MADKRANRVAADIIKIGREAYCKNLVAARAGNISVRLGDNRFMITAQGAPLGFLKQKDLVIVDLSSTKTWRAGMPSSETGLHTAIYKNTNAGAVVHVHPPYILTLARMGVDVQPLTFEASLSLGTVPCLAQQTPTVIDSEQVVQQLFFNNAVILQHHGIVSVGETAWDAFFLAELLEEAALMTVVTCLLRKGKTKNKKAVIQKRPKTRLVKIFSKEHMSLLTVVTNRDKKLQKLGTETRFSVSLGIGIPERGAAYTIVFKRGKIVDIRSGIQKSSLTISGTSAAWTAIFNGLMDPFAAIIQKKIGFTGSIKELSPWYPFLRSLFSRWQTIPVAEG